MDCSPTRIPLANGSMVGTLRRISRLFRHADGRAILTPIDHGLWYGPMPGIEKPTAVARQVMFGSDGLLISPGFARTIAAEMPSDCALALRIGTATDISPAQDYEAVFATMDTALRYDADMVAHTLYLGGVRDQEAISDAGQIVEAADRYSVPVILEFLPAREGWTAGQVAQWARLGFELGASAIKTVYTGDPGSFAQVTAGCPIPILIAGGPSIGTPADLLTAVSDSIAAGGAGLAIGRRVWQAPDPAALLRALAQVVHGQATVEDALSGLEHVTGTVAGANPAWNLPATKEKGDERRVK